MWILHFLPDAVVVWAVNLLLFTGIVLTVLGFFVHRITWLYQYQLLFKIVGICVLTVAVYVQGGWAIETKYRQEVAELKSRLAAAEAQSAQINQVITEKIVYRDRIVREKARTLVSYVDRDIVKLIPQECAVLPKEVVDLHNQAARPPQDAVSNKAATK